MSWEGFSKQLADLGYAIKFDDPGPGSLITFDASGRALLLTTEADLPDDFVQPLVAWNKQRVRIGRWMPVSCPKCGRTFHVTPAAAKGQPGLCRDCRVPHRQKRRVLAYLLALVIGISGALVAMGAFTAWLPVAIFFGLLVVALLCVIPPDVTPEDSSAKSGKTT